MHEWSPKHLRIGTAGMKSDKKTRKEGKKRRVNMEKSTVGRRVKMSRWAYLLCRRLEPIFAVAGRYSPKRWMNYLPNLTYTNHLLVPGGSWGPPRGLKWNFKADVSLDTTLAKPVKASLLLQQTSNIKQLILTLDFRITELDKFSGERWTYSIDTCAEQTQSWTYTIDTCTEQTQRWTYSIDACTEQTQRWTYSIDTCTEQTQRWTYSIDTSTEQTQWCSRKNEGCL